MLFPLLSCNDEDGIQDKFVSADEIISNMRNSLADIDAAEIDVDYFFQSGNDEPYIDEFIMLMKRDSTDPGVSAKIMIEPYNRFSGFLLTYVEGEYMAIDSTRKKVFIADRANGGSEYIRSSYRGDIAAVFFDKLYEFDPSQATNYIDTDTIVDERSYFRFVSVVEDSVTNMSERFIWHIDKETFLPMEWSRIYQKNDQKAFQLTKIKSINTQLTTNRLAFNFDYPSDYSVQKYRKESEVSPMLEIGQPAPEFSLADQNGQQFTLTNYRGKPTIIKFWGTWCGYCKKSLPLLRNVLTRYNDNINIVGISANEPEGADPQGYLDKNKYRFKTLVSGEKVAVDYKVAGFPTIYLLDKDGIIIKSFVGYDEELDKKLISTIEELL